MNSKKSNNQKSKATLKKNNQKSKSQNSTVANKIRWCRKITDGHEPFIFEQRAKGLSYRGIAEALGKECQLKVDHSSLFEYFKNRAEQYQVYLSDLKEVRLANAKARILDRQSIANKLKDKIFEILDISPIFWKDLNVASLIKEHNALLTQIQDESGDKVHKFKGEGLNGSNIVFGDQVVNTYADKVIEERRKEGVDSGSRFKKAGLSDFGDSLSSN